MLHTYISGATDLLFIIGNYFLSLVSLLVYTRELFFTASLEHYLNLIFGSKDTLGTLSAAKRGGAVPWQHGQEISTRSLVLIFVVVLSLTASLVLNLSVYTINTVDDDKYLGPFFFLWAGLDQHSHELGAKPHNRL